METDAGEWTDRSFAEVRAESPQAFAAFLAGDPAFAFPDGESFAEQEARVAAALEEIERGELPALIVCHGMVIRAALSVRAHHWLSGSERVPNGGLVPLDPIEAFAAAEPGSGAPTTPS